MRTDLVLLAVALTACLHGRAPEHPAMIGQLDRAEVERRLPDWQQAREQARPDGAASRALATVAPGADVVVYLGTWCSDSLREVTRLWRALDDAGAPLPFTVRWIGVDRDKVAPGGLLRDGALARVPTIVVHRGGREVGRIVETAPRGVERELLDLLRASAPERSAPRDPASAAAPVAPAPPQSAPALPVPAFTPPRGYQAVVGPGFAFAIPDGLGAEGGATFMVDPETPALEDARFEVRVAWSRFDGDVAAWQAQGIADVPGSFGEVLGERGTVLGTLAAREIEWRGSEPESDQAIERFAVQASRGFRATCAARRDAFESVRHLCRTTLDGMVVTATASEVLPPGAARGPGFMVVPAAGSFVSGVHVTDPTAVTGPSGLGSEGLGAGLVIRPFGGTLAELAEEALSSLGVVERLKRRSIRIAGRDALELESIFPGSTPPTRELQRLVLVEGRAVELGCGAGADVYPRFRARCRTIVSSLAVAAAGRASVVQ